MKIISNGIRPETFQKFKKRSKKKMEHVAAVNIRHSLPDVVLEENVIDCIEIMDEEDIINCDEYNEKRSNFMYDIEINSEETSEVMNDEKSEDTLNAVDNDSYFNGDKIAPAEEKCEEKIESSNAEDIRPESVELLKKLEGDVNGETKSSFDCENTLSYTFNLQKAGIPLDIEATDSIDEMVKKYEIFKSQQHHLCLSDARTLHNKSSVVNSSDSNVHEKDCSFSSTICHKTDEKTSESITSHVPTTQLEDLYNVSDEYESENNLNDDEKDKEVSISTPHPSNKHKGNNNLTVLKRKNSKTYYNKRKLTVDENKTTSKNLLLNKIKTFDNNVDIYQITSEEESLKNIDNNDAKPYCLNINDCLRKSVEDCWTLEEVPKKCDKEVYISNTHLSNNHKGNNNLTVLKRKNTQTYYNKRKLMIEESKTTSKNVLLNKINTFDNYVDILKITVEEESPENIDKNDVKPNCPNTNDYLWKSVEDSWTLEEVPKKCEKLDKPKNQGGDTNRVTFTNEDYEKVYCKSEIDSDEESITLLEIIDENNVDNVLTVFPDLISNIPTGPNLIEKSGGDLQIPEDHQEQTHIVESKTLQQEMVGGLSGHVILKTNADAFLYLSKLRQFLVKEKNFEALKIIVNLQMAFLFPE